MMDEITHNRKLNYKTWLEDVFKFGTILFVLLILNCMSIEYIDDIKLWPVLVLCQIGYMILYFIRICDRATPQYWIYTEEVETMKELETQPLNSTHVTSESIIDLIDLFNLNELTKEWEEWFDEWKPETLKLTSFEEKLIDDWTSNCLPRHMPTHDWNLPYAESCILVLRRLINER